MVNGKRSLNSHPTQRACIKSIHQPPATTGCWSSTQANNARSFPNPFEDPDFFQASLEMRTLLRTEVRMRKPRRAHINSKKAHHRLRSRHVAETRQQFDHSYRAILLHTSASQIPFRKRGQYPLINRRREVVAAANRADRAQRQRRQQIFVRPPGDIEAPALRVTAALVRSTIAITERDT